jgi:acetolactate decarboxylase
MASHASAVPLLAVCLAVACGSSTAKLVPAASIGDRSGPAFNMWTYGSLESLMAGSRWPVAFLSNMKEDPKLVGLGSLSDLRGEVLIAGGQVWVGYSNPDKSSTGRELGDSDETAAFLVTAQVDAWRTVSFPRPVPFQDLDDVVLELAQASGLDEKDPFPFVLEGPLDGLSISVVDGRGLARGQPIRRETLLAESAKSHYPRESGMIVGFFANEKRPEFLHPGARLHMHVLLRDRSQVGHVVAVDVSPETALRLPASRRN